MNSGSPSMMLSESVATNDDYQLMQSFAHERHKNQN